MLAFIFIMPHFICKGNQFFFFIFLLAVRNERVVLQCLMVKLFCVAILGKTFLNMMLYLHLTDCVFHIYGVKLTAG